MLNLPNQPGGPPPGNGGGSGGAGGSGGGGVDPGGSGGSGGGQTGTGGSGGSTLNPTFDLAAQLDGTTTNLGETHTATLTITPHDGFTGNIDLAAVGVPSNWTVQFQPTSTVSVTGTTPVTATALVQVPTMTPATTEMFQVTATSGSLSQMANLSLQVNGHLYIHIAQGVQTTNNPAAFGPMPTNVPFVLPGTQITWVNDDTIAHRIHSDNGNGFDHEPNDMAPGASYTVTITAGGNYPYHCHIHTGMEGQINVVSQ